MATRTSRGRLRSFALPRVDLRLVGGLLLVGLAVVGGLTLWRQAQVTVPVVVALREIPAGHVLEAADLGLTQARLEGTLAALALGETELAAAVGRTATNPIHAGALVVRPDLGSGPVIGPNDVAVTVPVEADSVYARLRRGDQVAVMATSDKGKPQSLTVALLERAIVYDVASQSTRVTLGTDSADDEGRLTNVTLLIPRSDAERVAHAVVNADLTLLLLAPPASGGSGQ